MKKIISAICACIMLFSTGFGVLAEENTELPLICQPFHKALGLNDMSEISHGTIVQGKIKAADIEGEDLQKWLDAYWNFNCDLVIMPMVEIANYDEYIKLWNKDETKSYTVFAWGVAVGRFGEPFEYNGKLMQNYVWYMPYIGNARNALYTASSQLEHKYFDKTYEEYTGTERAFTQKDEYSLPENNLLDTSNASQWAVPEIEKAAALNLLTYELTSKYTEDITRLEFAKLAYRFLATYAEPLSDSRMGAWSAVDSLIDQKNLRQDYNSVEFTDCSYDEVKFLAATGIIRGMGDGTFMPDEKLSREQAATMLFRLASFLGEKLDYRVNDKVYFDDEDSISDWAFSAVITTYKMDVMKGISDRIFSPQGTYTAEQAITTMVRLYDYIQETYAYETPLGEIVSDVYCGSWVNFAKDGTGYVTLVNDSENFIINQPVEFFTNQTTTVNISLDSFAEIFDGTWELLEDKLKFTYDTSKSIDIIPRGDAQSSIIINGGTVDVISFDNINTIIVNDVEMPIQGKYGGKTAQRSVLMYNGNLYIPAQVIADILGYEFAGII